MAKGSPGLEARRAIDQIELELEEKRRRQRIENHELVRQGTLDGMVTSPLERAGSSVDSSATSLGLDNYETFDEDRQQLVRALVKQSMQNNHHRRADQDSKLRDNILNLRSVNSSPNTSPPKRNAALFAPLEIVPCTLHEVKAHNGQRAEVAQPFTFFRDDGEKRHITANTQAITVRTELTTPSPYLHSSRSRTRPLGCRLGHGESSNGGEEQTKNSFGRKTGEDFISHDDQQILQKFDRLYSQILRRDARCSKL